MANQQLTQLDMSTAADEQGTDAVAINKDEPAIVTIHENGYESECSSSTRSDEDVARSALEVEADAFTHFIERQRTEVMFELRNLRMGERPVTGQPNRDRIQAFLNNIQERQRSVSRRPSTGLAVPSAHTADIDALTSRRYVSSALASTGFRRSLESAVRRSIETRTAAPLQSIPQAPPIPQTLMNINDEQQTALSLPLQAVPVIREPVRPQVAQAPAHEPFNVERQERELNSWQNITQLQREIIVVEISDLVHRQLVSSALESDFRTHLEQNILDRLARGAPPQQVQEQQGPAVPAPRVQPVPAAIRPTTTNTRTSAAAADDLSTRLDAMQHMLQVMFSMQMDMQRSLRQEVSSAIANSSSTTLISSSPAMNAGHCTVCLTAMADTVLYRCGHLCVCYMCGLNLRATTSGDRVKCPICRAPVDDILRVYRSSRDGEEDN